jgi:NodT family efflux transporter outer membrane factor (OMF) lipoprotein
MNWLGLALLLVGCEVGPNYKAPQTRMPAQYAFRAATQPATTQPVAVEKPPIRLAEWWRSFNDPILNDLINHAVQANLDLKIATARLIQARAQYGITYAGLFPTVDVDGQATRQRVSPNGPNYIAFPSQLTDSAGNTIKLPGGATPTYDLFQAGFDATWEMDVFGGQKRAVESAKADIQSSWESRNDVLVSLLAETARNYIEYRAFQRRLDLTRQDIRSEEESVTVTRQRFRAGLTNDLDVARAEAEVTTTTAQLPDLTRQMDASLQTLAVTLGTDAQSLAEELGPVKPIPVAPPNVPVGLPSDLLRRRPDVRAAERQIASATAQIGVATAELFPEFTLTGSLGLQSSHFKSIGNFNSRYWSIGPSVSWPLFDAGKIRSNIALQKAITAEKWANYQKTVLQALSDVETALESYTNERDRRVQLAKSVQALQRALDLANQLYKQGVGEFLDVLDAERSLFTAEDLLAQSDQAVSADLVSLYKALGGGWD